MMMRKSLVVVAVSAALAVATFAGSSSSQKSTITVGEFAVKVTSAIGQPFSDRKAAVESLKTLGVKIGDMNANLTEGIATKMLADLGLRVSTSSPNSAVTPGKADQLAIMAGLSSSAASVAPADVSDCLALFNRGLCNDCCNALVGCDPETGCGRPCAKLCKSVIPPGHQSPSDPEP